MKCVKCGKENADGSKFCNECGGILAGAPAGTARHAVDDDGKTVTVEKPGFRTTYQVVDNATPSSSAASAQPQQTSGLAVASLVLGIVAICTSLMPIINNMSFFVALVGFGLALAGMVSARKKNQKGRGLALAGGVLSVLSVVLVLASQAYYGAALDRFSDELKHGSQPTSAPVTSSTTASSSSTKVDYSHMQVGQSVTFESGLVVTVNSIEHGYQQKYGDPLTRVNVTYSNNGDKNQSFNMFDWKGADANGALKNVSFSMDSSNNLDSGDLMPGGSKNGDIFFEDGIVGVYYYSNAFLQDSSDICWVA